MEREKKNYIDFIEELMAYTGTTKADLARSLGTSWQNINEKFNTGDMKISKAEEIVEAMGYSLKISLDDGARVVTGDTVQKNVGGLLLQINDLMPEPGRLTPLKTFLRLHGKTFKQVAEDIGVSGGSMLKYFRDDDMFLSKLFWIADAYGWKVMVRIDRKQQA